MNRTTNSVFALLLSASAFAGSAFAEGLNRVDSATQELQRNNLKSLLQKPASEAVPSLYKDEAADVGIQYVVKPGKTKHQWIEALVDEQYGSTSNVYLTEKGQRQASMLLSTAQIAVTPPPIQVGKGTLDFKAGYRHQRFEFGVLDRNRPVIEANNFDASIFFAQGRYKFNENWIATTGLDYVRLLNTDTARAYDEFYSEVVPNVFLERRFNVDEKSVFAVGAGTSVHFTNVDKPNPGQNNRVDEVLMASYVRELAPSLYVQPFYRLQVSQFTQTAPGKNRSDIVQTVGVAVAYSFNKWASVRAYANFEDRDTTENSLGSAVSDYHKFDAGIGGSFQIRF